MSEAKSTMDAITIGFPCAKKEGKKKRIVFLPFIILQELIQSGS